ncbi:glycosyltransferase family 8 protein [bacterium]|nr:glycosyltransferase family 8 protein [bacterium]
MDICFTFDNRYYQYIFVPIISVIENNPGPINFHLITDKLSKKNEKLIEDWIRSKGSNAFIYKTDKKQFSVCPVKGVDNDRLTRAAYFRINIPQILPKEIKKVLYLDPDVMVLGSLSGLFELNIDNCPFAVVEVLNKSCNSGVMLMNLEYFRQHNLSERLFDYIEHNKDKIEYYDQDAFNNLIHGNWYKLPPKYNAGDILLSTLSHVKNMGLLPVYSDEEIEEAKKNPVIVHFAGSFHYKLWYENSIHSGQERYLAYKEKTPMKNAKLKTNYILYLMKGQDKPYEYVKEIVKAQIDKLSSSDGLKGFFVKSLNSSSKTRKFLYTFISYMLYLKKRYSEK